MNESKTETVEKMDSKKRKSRKRKWQMVAIEEPAFFASDMDGFVSLEELKDYHLEVTGNSTTGKLISIQEKKPKVSETQAVKKYSILLSV